MQISSYEILDELDSDKIRFITLRKRRNGLLRQMLNIPDNKWEKHKLDIPKRKNQQVSVYEEKLKLKNCKKEFRQIIINYS
ncbi:MAG: hypothetical protein V2B16_00375 [bacterium]